MDYLGVFIAGCILTYFGMRPELKRLDAYCKELQGRENFRIGYKHEANQKPQHQADRHVVADLNGDKFPDLFERQKAALEAD